MGQQGARVLLGEICIACSWPSLDTVFRALVFTVPFRGGEEY